MRSKRPVLGFVPLDDRPVSWEQAVALGRSSGYDILLPPAEVFDRPDALAAWLERSFAKATGWVASLDRLAYGGLVASRELREPLSTCLRRLAALSRAKKKKPAIPLYAFQAIRRKSVTVSSSADLAAWRKNHKHVDPLPAHRERNHRVNMEAARLSRRGVIDVLSLLQEDSTPAGPHKAEQAALRRVLAKPLSTGRAALTAGTDEGAMVLLSRLMAALEGRRLAVRLRFWPASGAKRISPYEDRPLASTAKGQAKALGAALGAGLGRGGFSLWIWCPCRPGGDLCFKPARTSGQAEARRFAAALAKALDAGATIAVADTAYANGADPVLLSELSRAKVLPRLAGFAAWNTAGNAIGTALALAALARPRPGLLVVRLLDDWGFQAVVRPGLRQWVRERLKADEWRLRPAEQRKAQRELDRRLGGWSRAVLRPLFKDAPISGFSLPWNRLFEVSIPCPS
ncbi:MAG: DUF4127 family protein [Elusimicrobiota bacterium]|jgi:hypothetical protein